MARAIAENKTHYLQTTGVPRLRELIAAKLRDKNRIPVDDAEDVLVTNGGIHGLYIICQALLEPGDEVLIPDPEWPPAAGNVLARAAASRSACPLHEAHGWRYDLDELESKITPKTRVLYLNSPSNPTGGVLDARGSRAARRDRARAQPVGDLRRSLRGRRLRRRARQHRVAAGHVRADDSALHVQQVVRDDRPAARLRRDQGRRRSATARRRCCSTRPATSRRSCSSAASARSKDRRTASRTFRTRAARAARSLLPRHRASSAGDIFCGQPPAGAFYAFLRIDPAWSARAPAADRSSVADGRVPDQERPHRLRAGRGLRRAAAKATSASASRAIGRS